MTTKFKTPILLFDDTCLMCTRFKQALDLIPGSENIQKVSIYESDIYKQFPQITMKECEQVVHLIDENGNIHKGGEVIRYLAKTIPYISRLAWLLDNEAGKKATDLFYQAVNKVRHSPLNSCKSCHK